MPTADGSGKLAGQVRTIFQNHCIQCHGSDKTARADLKILDHNQLVNPNRSLVVKGKPDESALLQLVECGSMPPGTARKVSEADLIVLREWVAAGAPDFPPRSSESDILAQIQLDVNKLAPADRANVRYLSLNHLLDDPDAAKDLDAYRAALVKALNLLSTKAKIVDLEPIDPDRTIFRIRINALGWDKRPFAPNPQNAVKEIDPGRINLYDLILLEYPHATPLDDSAQSKILVETYLNPLQMVRPVPYVRGDWFAAVATEAPLYNDLLMLPASLPGLEKKLGVEQSARNRAGLTTSEYIRLNRVLERGSNAKAVYWRTFDLELPKTLAGLLKEATAESPEHLGGEAIFSLPNGLPGFYVADASFSKPKEGRLDAIPAGRLVAKPASGGMPNGRSCMACHAAGLRPFKDEVAKNAGETVNKEMLAKWYPPLDEAVAEDNGRFATTLAKLPGQPAGRDPLALVVEHYARKPARGLLPIDGLGMPASTPLGSPVKIELETQTVDGKPATVFHLNEMVRIYLKNAGIEAIKYEFVATDRLGRKIPLGVKTLQAGGFITFDLPTGKKREEAGQEHMIVFASEEALPAGVICKPAEEGVTARYIHALSKIDEDNKTIRTLLDPTRVVKKTVTFETVGGKE